MCFGVAVLAAACLCAAAGAWAQSDADLCDPPEPGVNCGPGNDRRSTGGGDKVPHHNGLNSRRGQRPTRFWPKVSGILWQVVDPSRDPLKARTKLGGPLNDELLGRHGTDTLLGGGGHDIIWGDWDPVANNTRQRDVLSGGLGNDWLYPSHGRSIVRAGRASTTSGRTTARPRSIAGPASTWPASARTARSERATASRSDTSAPTARAGTASACRRPARRCRRRDAAADLRVRRPRAPAQANMIERAGGLL